MSGTSSSTSPTSSSEEEERRSSQPNRLTRSRSEGNVAPLHVEVANRHPKTIVERNLFTNEFREIIPYPGAWVTASQAKGETDEETYYRSPPLPTPAPRKKRDRDDMTQSPASSPQEPHPTRRDLRASPSSGLTSTPSPPRQASSPYTLTVAKEQPHPTQRSRDPRIAAALERAAADQSTPTASTSYATAAAAAPTTPPVTTKMTNAPQPQPSDTRKAAYPPIVVEELPNWTKHFAELRKILGQPPNGRPFGKGVRFIPKTGEEYRAIQKYLSDTKDPISWYSYTPTSEQPVKAGIRGLPGDTPPEEIARELETQYGFKTIHIRRISPRRGRPGCLFFVQIEPLDKEELAKLWKITELLYMPGVTIEAWRGRRGPAQCHRCQGFGHSSANCHRTCRCVRCGENHPATDCPRPKTDPATCANCGKNHPANDRRCPIFKKEARKKGQKATPLVPDAAPAKETKKQQARKRQRPVEEPDIHQSECGAVSPTTATAKAVAGAITTLMPPANQPKPQKGTTKPPAQRKSRSRRRKRKSQKEKLPEPREAPAREVGSQPTKVPAPRPTGEEKPKSAAQPTQPPKMSTEVPWSIVHGILMDILTALTTKEELLPVVLRGLATLATYQHVRTP